MLNKRIIDLSLWTLNMILVVQMEKKSFYVFWLDHQIANGAAPQKYNRENIGFLQQLLQSCVNKIKSLTSTTLYSRTARL